MASGTVHPTIRGSALDLAMVNAAAVLSEPKSGTGRVRIRRVSDAAIFLYILRYLFIVNLGGGLIFRSLLKCRNRHGS
jgi:hypothetical protein